MSAFHPCGCLIVGGGYFSKTSYLTLFSYFRPQARPLCPNHQGLLPRPGYPHRRDPYYDNSEYVGRRHVDDYYNEPSYKDRYYEDPYIKKSADSGYSSYDASVRSDYRNTPYATEEKPPLISFDYSHGGVKSAVDGHVTPMAFKRGRGSQFHARGRGDSHSNSFHTSSPVETGGLLEPPWNSSGRGRGYNSGPPESTSARGRGSNRGLPSRNGTSSTGSLLSTTSKQKDEIHDLNTELKNVAKSQPSKTPGSSGAMSTSGPKDTMSTTGSKCTVNSKNNQGSKDSLSDNNKISHSQTKFHQVSSSQAKVTRLDPGSVSQTSTDKHPESALSSESKSMKSNVVQKSDPSDSSEEEDEEDTGFCKFCKIDFKSAESFWRHTRGMLHIQRMMDYQDKKKEGKTQAKVPQDSAVNNSSKVTIARNESSPSQSKNNATPIRKPEHQSIGNTEEVKVSSAKTEDKMSSAKTEVKVSSAKTENKPVNKVIPDNKESKPDNMISSFAQSLLSSAKSEDCVIKPSYELPPYHKPPRLKSQTDMTPRSQGPHTQSPRQQSPLSMSPRHLGPQSQLPETQRPQGPSSHAHSPRQPGPQSMSPRQQGPQSQPGITQRPQGPRQQGAQHPGPPSLLPRQQGPQSMLPRQQATQSMLPRQQGPHSMSVRPQVQPSPSPSSVPRPQRPLSQDGPSLTNISHTNQYSDEWQENTIEEPPMDYDEGNDWSQQLKETEIQSQDKGDNQDEEEEDSEEEVDTSYCLYCDIHFTNPDSYWKHTRGIQHTQFLMDYERKKREEGEKFFKTETVDAGPKIERRDSMGRRILTAKEKQEMEEEKRQFVKAQIKLVLDSSEEEQGDYDFNKSNWMELDPLQKPKIPAKDKDLNPDDIGKEQFPDEFYCEICDVRCTGAVTYKMHIEGNKHKTKERVSGKKASSAQNNIRIVPCDKPALINKSLECIPDPIVGLQYVTEFQRQDDRPRYVCNQCEVRCDSNSILSHIVGLKHRLRYFKEHYPDSYQKMVSFSSRKKSEQNSFAEEFARDIETREGRQDVKVKLEVNTTTELAAADLIKSGALDYLLEGSGLTKEKIKNLDITSLRPEVQEIEKEKIEPVIKKDKDRSTIEKTEREKFQQGKKTQSRLLPTKEEREKILSSRSGLPKGRQKRQPSRKYSDEFYERYTGGYPDRRMVEDPYYDRRDDPYYSSRVPEYGSPMSDGGFTPVVVDYGHSNTPVKDIKPTVVDYGHNKQPMEKPKVVDYGHSPGSREGSLDPTERKAPGTMETEEDRAVKKREHGETKTEEELFQEFMKWKRAKLDPAEVEPPAQQSKPPKQTTVTSENYEYQPTTSATPTSVMASAEQPMELPSYSTVDQSKQKKGKPEAKPPMSLPQMDLPDQKDLPPQAQELLATLSKSMIHSEDEAAMALQVSNALTQALLEYQLKNISKELQNTVQQQQQKQKTLQKPATITAPAQQQQVKVVPPVAGKTEKPKPMKKQRFDAYSILQTSASASAGTMSTGVQAKNSQGVKKPVQKTQGNPVQVSTGKLATSVAAPLKSRASTLTSQHDMLTASQSLAASMSSISAMYKPTQEMMTSQSHDPSAQAMMRSSQGMMSSVSVAGYQAQTGTSAYDMGSYQQFQNVPPGYVMSSQAYPGYMAPSTVSNVPFTTGQGHARNFATSVQQSVPGTFVPPPPGGWNQYYGVPQPVPPPLPPLPKEEYPKPPPPPE